MADRLRELIANYKRMYMGELLTEGAERITYLEGVIDGLEIALEVVNDDKRES